MNGIRKTPLFLLSLLVTASLAGQVKAGGVDYGQAIVRISQLEGGGGFLRVPAAAMMVGKKVNSYTNGCAFMKAKLSTLEVYSECCACYRTARMPVLLATRIPQHWTLRKRMHAHKAAYAHCVV